MLIALLVALLVDMTATMAVVAYLVWDYVASRADIEAKVQQAFKDLYLAGYRAGEAHMRQHPAAQQFEAARDEGRLTVSVPQGGRPR